MITAEVTGMQAGIQVSSLKPVLTTPQEVETAFAGLQAMGCGYVQLQWIDPAVPVEWIAECLRKTGIISVSVQDFYETVRQDQEYYIRLNRLTGGRWMCVSRIPERLKTREGLDAYVRELRSFQKELDKHGQLLCLHPVAADFEAIEGLDPVAYLLDAMPEMHVCADLYHLNKVGKDICEWLRQYRGRVCMVHFKDKLGTGTQEQLVPAGQGDIDWTGVADACREIGVDYAFAEQERWQGDPFACLQQALEWLRKQ